MNPFCLLITHEALRNTPQAISAPFSSFSFLLTRVDRLIADHDLTYYYLSQLQQQHLSARKFYTPSLCLCADEGFSVACLRFFSVLRIPHRCGKDDNSWPRKKYIRICIFWLLIVSLNKAGSPIISICLVYTFTW